jgi:hypothetical protein
MKKYAIIFLWMLLTLGLFSPCHAADYSLDDVDVTTSSVSDKGSAKEKELNARRKFNATFKEAYQQALKDYDELTSATNQTALEVLWNRLETDGVPGDLIGCLIQNLVNKKSCAFQDQKIELDNQDVSFIGGRCAWLLQKIFRLKFEKIEKNTLGAVVEKISFEVNKKSNEALLYKDANAIKAKLAGITAEEKIQFIKENKFNAHELHFLAYDASPEVRRSVASNFMTPFEDVSYMQDYDTDQSVRQLASKNLESARTIKLDINPISDNVSSRTFYFRVQDVQ